MRPYSLDTAPPELRSFLAQIIDDARNLVGENLIAAILHGSLAMGSFYPPKSDIDLLLVASDLSEPMSARLYELFEQHHNRRPYAAGLEVSVLRASDAERPRHPAPFLVHFSSGTKGPQTWAEGVLPVDHDLMAHLMVAKSRGVSLFGPPPNELIGPIAWEDYVAAVKSDIDELLSGDTVLRSPRYAVLNLCRWAMMRSTEERLVPSKEEAALWALDHLPMGHRPIVAQALDVYRSDEPVRVENLILAGEPWDENALVAFRDHIGEGG